MSDITPIAEKLDKIDASMELTLAISEKDQMIADLKETIEYLKKMVFGRKSEKSKYYDMPGQFDIYDMFGVEKPADDNVIERHETAKEISGYTRKEKKKKSTYDEMYEKLPAERVVIPVSDKGRICRTVERKWSISEKSMYVPRSK